LMLMEFIHIKHVRGACSSRRGRQGQRTSDRGVGTSHRACLWGQPRQERAAGKAYKRQKRRWEAAADRFIVGVVTAWWVNSRVGDERWWRVVMSDRWG
jgi:hypothetical protein